MVKSMIAMLMAILLAVPLHAQDGKPAQALFLPTGTQIRITITNAIFSYNLATPVAGELESGASFLGRMVLPEKTKLLGRALILKSHDRLNIEFDLAVMPDGREVPLSGIALSPDGSAGIKGKVEKHKDSAVASAALKGAILGAAAMTSAAVNPMAAEAGQAVAEEATKTIDLSNQQVDVSISVPAFTRCLVHLTKRLELNPTEENKNANP